MIIRPVAEIVPDFLDDQLEAMARSGLAVATAIAEMLRGLGYKVAGPFDRDFKGWEIDLEREGYWYWIRVTDLGDGNHFLATRILNGWFLTKLRKHAQFLRALDKAMRLDGRFNEIRWHSMDSRGRWRDTSDVPVDWEE